MTPAQIAEWLRVFAESDQVVELRIPDAGRAGTVSGYYDDFEKFGIDAAHWSGQADSVYFTLNRISPALLAWVCNRYEERSKSTTSDADVERWCWMFVDFDPKRPSGVSATEAEKQRAKARAQECRNWLRGLGWPLPVACDSGKGFHLPYRIDLPNDTVARDLLKRCLEALSLQFTDDNVKVDETTFNAARICKVYGTLAAKGDDTTGKTKATRDPRPHRFAKVLRVPNPVEAVDPGLLKALAAMAPKVEETGPRVFRMSAGEFDLDGWVEKHGLPVVQTGPWGDGGKKWVLSPCPWNEAHTNRAAYIVRLKSGAIAAGCHHDGCASKCWHDLRFATPAWAGQGVVTRGLPTSFTRR